MRLFVGPIFLFLVRGNFIIFSPRPAPGWRPGRPGPCGCGGGARAAPGARGVARGARPAGCCLLGRARAACWAARALLARRGWGACCSLLRRAWGAALCVARWLLAAGPRARCAARAAGAPRVGRAPAILPLGYFCS